MESVYAVMIESEIYYFYEKNFVGFGGDGFSFGVWAGVEGG